MLNNKDLVMRYTVKRGDTLSELAVQYNVTVEQLMNANPHIRNPDKIIAGDVVDIPVFTGGLKTWWQKWMGK